MKSDVVVGLKQIALTTALVASLVTPAAYAEDNSAKLDDGSVSTGLSMNLKPAHHKFMRLSYIFIKPNTKTSPTKDLTGPVVSRQDAQCLQSGTCIGPYVPSSSSSSPIYPNLFGVVVGGSMDNEATMVNGVPSQSSGIGLPTGITADAKGAGSLALSAGTFFDDEYKWSAEIYVFAWPFTSVVNGGGSVTEISSTGTVLRTRPNYIAGKEIIKTQELPPTAVFSYYFGNKNSAFRPFIGVGVTYAMFFNTHATETLSQYSGGPTEVKIKNAFGAGPFLGLQYRLNENWHLAAQFGYVKLKTTATLTTQTDATALAQSHVLQDFSGYVGNANRDTLGTQSGLIIAEDGLRALQGYRGGSLGTYVRSMDTKLDPYIMTVSVGYDF